jgi:hypothetical protein
MGDLAWGLQIGALGIGLVFALLALLWALLALALRLDRPAEAAGAAAPAAARPGEPPSPSPAPGPEPALVAAITVAVLSHSAHLRGEAVPTMRIHWPGSLLYASRWVAAGRVRQTRAWQRTR